MQNSKKVKTLEELVASVDYDWLNNDYVPIVEAIHFINFIKLVNGEQGESHKSPTIHFHMVENALKHSQSLSVVFRGGSKTSLLHEYLCLYIAVHGELPLFGQVDVAMYVSDTIENGVRSLRNQLEHRYLNSDFLQRYIKSARFTDDEWEFENLDNKKFFIKGFGASTGVRGFKRYGKRPQLCLLDDLLSDKNARSPTIIQSINDIIYKAIRAALDPTRRKTIWTGTVFNKKDPLYKAASVASWNAVAYPVCEKMPCSREEFRGAWEDRFSYDFLLSDYQSLRESGQTESFDQEMMLKITSEEDRLILDSNINFYVRNTLLHNLSSYNFYITTDFATSEKESADFSVIMVWAINSAGIIFLVDGLCERQVMIENINALFKFVQKYKPQSVGIEITGQQGGFLSWIKNEMLIRNVWFMLANHINTKNEGIRPTTDKLKRFTVVAAWFRANRMFLPEEMKHTEFLLEVIDELSFATKSGLKSSHDDCIDAISMLSLMDLNKPSDDTFLVYDEKKHSWFDPYFEEEEEKETALSRYL